MTVTRPEMTPLRIWMLIFFGCLIGTLTFGPRAIMGLFLTPMTDAQGWSVEAFSFAIALQNLIWGAAQPVAGIFADRYGTVRTFVIGTVGYVLGLYIMANATDVTTLTLSAGVLVGMGIAFSAFFLVISAFARMLPEKYHGLAFGLGTASGSFGQLVFSPLCDYAIQQYGYVFALYALVVCAAVVPFLAIPFRGKPEVPKESGVADQSVREALAEAFGHRSYLLLLLGFFVCGYHVVFIITHMPAYVEGVFGDKSLGANSVAVIGFFNIFGALISGSIMMKVPKRYILSFIYLGRAIIITAFVLMPVSVTSVLVFSGAMGLLWLSTIPPTQGLVKVMFGTRYLATLFGMAFFSHQLGAFMGVWLGGKIFTATGSYDLMWWSAVIAGLAAAALHWPIREHAYGRLATAG